MENADKGKVLLAGGGSDETGRSARAEIYDPRADLFTFSADMVCGRAWHATTLLPNGTVLAAWERDGGL